MNLCQINSVINKKWHPANIPLIFDLAFRKKKFQGRIYVTHSSYFSQQFRPSSMFATTLGSL